MEEGKKWNTQRPAQFNLNCYNRTIDNAENDTSKIISKVLAILITTQRILK
jgi:hypothetical protein